MKDHIAIAAERKKDEVLAAAIGGLSRVAEAIVSLSYQQRIEAIDGAPTALKRQVSK